MSALQLVSRYGLPSTAQVAVGPLSDGEWRALVAVVEHQRIVGLLAAAMEGGALEVTSAQAADVVSLSTMLAVRSVTLERVMLEALGVLDAAGVPARVLKGPAVAHLDYDDPQLRQFGDVDLLLPGHAFNAGIAALLGAGATRPVPELRPGFDRRFGKGVTLVWPGGAELDVHRTLVAGPYGHLLHLGALWAEQEAVTIGGRAVHALSRRHRFVHACYHAALGDLSARLSVRRDVAQLLTHPAFDWPAVREAVSGWQGEPVLSRALTLASEALLPELDHPAIGWARARPTTSREQRMIDAYLSSDGRFSTQALATLRHIDGIGSKLAFTRALLFPAPEHLAARGQRGRGHLRARGATPASAPAPPVSRHRARCEVVTSFLEPVFTTRTFGALSHRFRVRTSDAALAELIDGLFDALAIDGGDEAVTTYDLCCDRGGLVWQLAIDGEATGHPLEEAWFPVQRLMWSVNRGAVATEGLLLVHAAVAVRDGMGVVLPAAMEAGKTTLVTALVQRGFDYLSDEIAAYDPGTGRLLPYPKPLSIDQGSWHLFPNLAPPAPMKRFFERQWQVAPSAVRADAVARWATPAVIISPSYSPGATAELTDVPRVEMLQQLAEQTFGFLRRPQRSLEGLVGLVDGRPSYRLRVDDLDSACAAIAAVLPLATGASTR